MCLHCSFKNDIPGCSDEYEVQTRNNSVKETVRRTVQKLCHVVDPPYNRVTLVMRPCNAAIHTVRTMNDDPTTFTSVVLGDFCSINNRANGHPRLRFVIRYVVVVVVSKRLWKIHHWRAIEPFERTGLCAAELRWSVSVRRFQIRGPISSWSNQPA